MNFALSEATIVHFALHGQQDAEAPMESSLLLDNGSELKLSRLIELNLPNVDLVYRAKQQLVNIMCQKRLFILQVRAEGRSVQETLLAHHPLEFVNIFCYSPTLRTVIQVRHTSMH